MKWLSPFNPGLYGAIAAVYGAQGVHFDGSNDVVKSAAMTALTGAVDGKVGICSFWLKMQGGDGSFTVICEDQSGFNIIQLARMADNTIRIDNYSALGAINAVRVSTTSTFASGMSWAHILVAWDVGNSFAKIYVNDVDATASSPVINNVNINYSTVQPSFGARPDLSFAMNADIADFYYNTAEFLDITTSANRRKFISAGLAPVDLGSDGSTPTGTAPIIYLHGTTSSWHTNDGTGGGFTLTGALTDASTNPP